MKNKNIELAQLIYDFEGDIQKAETVFKFRNGLSDKGFEVYCKYFFQFIEGYKTQRNREGVYNNGDGCIDIKGIKKDGNTIFYLIVQCKRLTNDLKLSQVREFWGAVEKIKSSYPNTNVHFITTGRATQRSLEFVKNRNFTLKDYRNIIDLNILYSYEQFEKDISNSLFEYHTIFKPIQSKLFDDTIDHYTYKREMMCFLRTIRKKIAQKNQLSLFDICSNNSLELIVEKRLHNFEKIKESVIFSMIDYREKKRLEKFGADFNMGLEYIKIANTYIFK